MQAIEFAAIALARPSVEGVPLTPASVLDRDGTCRYVAIIGLLSAIGLLVGYGVGLHGGWPLPVDRHGVPLGRDFLNTWFYGRAFFAPDPGRFYDRALYTHMVHTMFPQDAADRLWSYPPAFLLVAAPFGRLPYALALAAWTVCGLGALGLAVRQRGSLWLVAAILTSPVVIYSVIAGQLSLLAGAILVTAFAQLDRRPVLAGLLLALLVVKPQTILLVPILLLVSRRWTVLISAAGGAIALVGLSIAVNGVDAWVRFVEIGLPAQVAEMRDTIDILAPISASVTTAAVEAQLPPVIVSGLQTASTLLAVVLVAWVGWRRPKAGRTSDYEGLVVLACSVFATPYFLIHDLVALTAVAVVVSYREGLVRNRFVLLALLYAPLMQSALGPLHIFILPALALGFAVWLVVRRPAVDVPDGSQASREERMDRGTGSRITAALRPG